MDGRQDTVEEFAGDRDLGKLEGDRARMANDPGADLDQSRLQARQGPCRNLVGQLGTM